MKRTVGVDLALDLADEACGKFRHGAVLVRGNKIISAAYNTPEHHAERRCFMQCPRRFLKNPRVSKGLVLYVARRMTFGDVGPSKPCGACQKLIRAMQIGTVVYTWPSDMPPSENPRH